MDENHKNLSRELLYVAVTRAKEKVIIIGSKKDKP
ncbi:MAG: ATP-binding domain-containing protein [Clostridium sp.]